MSVCGVTSWLNIIVEMMHIRPTAMINSHRTALSDFFDCIGFSITKKRTMKIAQSIATYTLYSVNIIVT